MHHRAHGSGDAGDFFAGFVLVLIAEVLTALVFLYGMGYLSLPSATDEVSAATPTQAVTARPTAAWPFRSEWLTPHP